ncbi:MAG: hypothetical protein WD294_10905 [Phycisphaeraceae bacterium]
MMSEQDEVSLTVRAVFDHAAEAVGVDAVGSPAFEGGEDTRAMIEILAAITAKANCVAAEVIEHWNAPDERKQELYEHFAALKENMLNDMLQQLRRSGGGA